MRIGCDLDGTLADMDAALQREAHRLFGPGVTLPSDTLVSEVRLRTCDGSTSPHQDAAAPATQRMTARQLSQLWTHVSGLKNFWLSLDEIEADSVVQLAGMAAAHRWEVIFLTQRPATAGDTAQVQSQRWLQARGFPLPAVYVGGASRGTIAAALDLHVVLDDRPENCLDVVASSRARAFLVWRGDRGRVPAATTGLGIDVVPSVVTALEQIQAMSSGTGTRSRLLKRLRHAIQG